MDNLRTGNLIKELRTGKGLTQKELAEKLSVSVAAVSKWENGKGFPDISILEPLSEALDISITEIIKGEKISGIEETDSLAKDIIEISKKERKSSRFVNAFVIAVLSFTIILVFSYVVFDMWSNYKITSEFSLSSAGLVGLFAFLFGGNAVVFGLFNLIFGRKYSLRKSMQIGLFSEACCCGAIWLTSVYTSYKISIGDISAVLDTAKGFEMYSQILFLSVVLINAYAYHNIVREK
ncbi:MAG: helix-turn-helix transcriptional regulator [Oscillospiraceae bacterium]|nr:helix-turn-helix transcriptional regulator [Oscillospiraceae bacterium]